MACATLLLSVTGGAVHAGTVDFEDIAPASNVAFGDVFTSGDYTFTANGGGAFSTLFVYDDPEVCGVGLNVCTFNGTTSLVIYDGNVVYPLSARMTRTDGGKFSVTGFDFAPLFAGSDAAPFETLTVTGDLGGGGVVSQVLEFQDGGSFATAVLSGFEGLKSLEFSSNSYWTSLDNIEVQAVPVPVPAGLLLMGTALAGLGFAGRRKG